MHLIKKIFSFLNKKKIKIGEHYLELKITNPHELQYWKTIKNNDYCIAKTFINENYKVLDLGANIGFTALLYLSFGADEVYAFEPVPKLAKRIKKINTNKIKIFDFAIADREGLGNIYLSSTHNQGHTLNKEFTIRFNQVFKKEKIIQIKITTLDTIFKNEIFDFIKIDIEGMEEKAIIGGEKFFERNKNAVVQIEIYNWQFIKTHQLLSRFYSYTYAPLIENCEIIKYERIVTIEDTKNIDFKGPPNYIYVNQPITC